MPSIKKRKSTRQSIPLNKELDDEGLPCCKDNVHCPIKARSGLKDRLFKLDNNFYLPDLMLDQERELEGVISQCVSFGESNSMLVIGPRGSGKSKLLRKVLSEISTKFKENYYYVYLSGIIHTDDRAALQDMARQLELENVIGDRVFGSFSDNLTFILDALKQDTGVSKSVVIVLDEFDYFAAHKNQSLLYNLFDIAQSKQNPICVIGITCRLDVVELLEKRVKSRYSHRTILTFPTYEITQYLDIFRNLLILPDTFECHNFKIRWDNHIKGLLDEKVVTDLLEKHFNIKKDIGTLIKLLILPISSITTTHPFITTADISSSYWNIHIDSKSAILKGLSVLELCLIIAAKHVLERRDGQPFNFEMLFNEYQNFARRRLTGGQSYNKAVAFKAYEHLLALELFKSTEVLSHNNLAKEYKPICMLIDNTQILDTVKQYAECPTELKNWAHYMFT